MRTAGSWWADALSRRYGITTLPLSSLLDILTPQQHSSYPVNSYDPFAGKDLEAGTKEESTRAGISLHPLRSSTSTTHWAELKPAGLENYNAKMKHREEPEK
ncbi:unnamed protein product [Symbiodinium sp. CCMP2456]|nr:unnamed protein product [Symbiodinium sp. CCMP2456]